MKNQKSKLITFMLAAMLGATALGGALASSNVTASADMAEITASISEMFSATDAKTGADTTEATKLAFTYEKTGTVKYRNRSLALKWFNEEGKKEFLTLKFTLDENFKEVSFDICSAPAWAVTDDKTINTVKFYTEENDGTKTVKVSVNGQAAVTVANPTQELTLELNDEAIDETAMPYGELDVRLNGESIGKFENVGENYAKYIETKKGSTTEKNFPLEITATPIAASNPTKVIFSELNKQSLALTDGKITDNAAPVLVVNDQISSFLLGTGFNVDYIAIDVVDQSVSTPTMTYYQYNPEDAEAEKLEYKTLTKSTTSSSGTYFMETLYDANWKNVGQEGYVADIKSVYAENNNTEFVSIKFEVKDDARKDADKGAIYELAWYAMETAKPAGVVADSKQDIDYIKLDRNTEGASYTFITPEKTAGADGVMDTADDKWENKKADNYDAIVSAYQGLIEKAASGILAGSSSEADVNLPQLTGWIYDNNGYKNLKFVICYRATLVSETSTSTLSYDALKLRASKSGDYEFKIYATDKANNPMMYALDGELVEVDSTNIWDIDEIPLLRFHIKNADIKVEEGTSSSSRKESVTLDKSYTLSSFTVLGASSPASEYALYKVTGAVSESALYSVKFEDIAKKANEVARKAGESDKDYYKRLYELCLGAEGSLTEIQEYNSAIDKDEDAEAWDASDNKYNWNASNKTFTAAEEGRYVIIGVFTDTSVAAQKAAAYKVILVDGPEDIIQGETEWLKNNIASVILFGVAALMLVAIVILSLVKPSDETLEDLDAPAEKEESEEQSDNE